MKNGHSGAAAEKLASDPDLTDYDFWRTLKNLDYEIFRRAAASQPIPIDMLRWRRFSSARARNGPAARDSAAAKHPEIAPHPPAGTFSP